MKVSADLGVARARKVSLPGPPRNTSVPPESPRRTSSPSPPSISWAAALGPPTGGSVGSPVKPGRRPAFSVSLPRPPSMDAGTPRAPESMRKEMSSAPSPSLAVTVRLMAPWKLTQALHDRRGPRRDRDAAGPGDEGRAVVLDDPEALDLHLDTHRLGGGVALDDEPPGRRVRHGHRPRGGRHEQARRQRQHDQPPRTPARHRPRRGRRRSSDRVAGVRNPPRLSRGPRATQPAESASTWVSGRACARLPG